MAVTQLNTASRIEKWDSEFMVEYVRDTPYMPFMGRKNTMMPIVTKYELTSSGKAVNVPLITRLTGSGVGGYARLNGNEEVLGNYNQRVTVHWNRNGVIVSRPDEHWTEMDLRSAARTQLRVWASEWLRDDITTALMAYDDESYLKGYQVSDSIVGGRTPLEAYSAVAEATKDAWLAANADRYLFGAAVVNNASNDHSAALAEIDTTADRMSTAIISLAKERAKAADRHIRPYKAENAAGREHFVLFCGARGFRDLKRDDAMEAANREARVRGVSDNPIFQDGDLVWDGVVIREVPEIPVLTGVGASTSDVEPAFLCGAQAACVVWGQEPRSRVKKEDDYGFEYGVAIEECRGVSKMAFNGVQNGMVNMFVSAPASA